MPIFQRLLSSFVFEQSSHMDLDEIYNRFNSTDIVKTEI